MIKSESDETAALDWWKREAETYKYERDKLRRWVKRVRSLVGTPEFRAVAGALTTLALLNDLDAALNGVDPPKGLHRYTTLYRKRK